MFIVSYLRVMTGLAVEIERLDVLRPEADLRHLVEPRLDLALEFRLVSDRARLVERPSGRHVLAYAEPVCVIQREYSKRQGCQFSLNSPTLRWRS